MFGSKSSKASCVYYKFFSVFPDACKFASQIKPLFKKGLNCETLQFHYFH